MTQFYSDMANRWLTVLFTVGKFLTITPPYNSKVSRLQTICTLVAVTLEVPLILYSTILRELYIRRIYTKVVVALLVDFHMLMFLSCTSLTVVLWKKTQWQKLIENLRIIASNGRNSKKIIQHVKISLARLVLNLTILIGEYWYWVTVFHFSSYVRVYNAHYVGYYLIFSFNIFLNLILIIVLTQYRFLNNILQTQIDSEILCLNQLAILLRQIESNLFFLKDTVDLINDICSWPFTVVISFTTFYTLNNFHFIFQNVLWQHDGLALEIVADVIMSLLTFVSTMFWKYPLNPKCFLQFGTCVVIITCDLILKEAETMLSKSYVLRRPTKMLTPKDKEVLTHFSDIILQNFPRFSAARFFNIDRSTIVSILGTVVSFLIIMIQFENTRF
jgi:gustatory receptor